MPLVVGHSQVKYLGDYLCKSDFSVFSYPGAGTLDIHAESYLLDITRFIR